MFTWAVLNVEFRLVLHAFGMGPVDVSHLIGALDGMRMNISALNPMAEPSF
jgi:hypothetical protein